ncbi:hypothetical protein B566_EDAN014061 [Ephemera danica]|nr:hypothetical protein B566_EDAN014061 [Ephemera danica]
MRLKVYENVQTFNITVPLKVVALFLIWRIALIAWRAPLNCTVLNNSLIASQSWHTPLYHLYLTVRNTFTVNKEDLRNCGNVLTNNITAAMKNGVWILCQPSVHDVWTLPLNHSVLNSLYVLQNWYTPRCHSLLIARGTSTAQMVLKVYENVRRDSITVLFRCDARIRHWQNVRNVEILEQL